jgi:MYXO-CTERM domain-containing protein
VIVPPVVPPPVVTDPCHCQCVCPPPPNCIPEPATIVSGLFGLAAAAGYGLVRRKKTGEEKTGDAAT